MALRDLLVYVDQTEGARSRLRLAADLARRHDSRLSALFVRELSQTQLDLRKKAELGLASGENLDRLYRGIESSIDESADRLHALCKSLAREHRIEIEWRDVDGTALVVVPDHARYADLCVLGPTETDDGAAVGYKFSEQLLFVTGRPLVFIPSSGSFETLGRHIVIGWNASRPATRAVSDALPLIERAERTTVITVDSADFVDRDGTAAANQLVVHLRRHNAAVEAVTLKNVPSGSIAAALQAEVDKLGADLIVTGAYGHPKIWERLVGGVTRDLLDRMSSPILMSH
jgi:nucleotide-binding universal stress UspA family protein